MHCLSLALPVIRIGEATEDMDEAMVDTVEVRNLKKLKIPTQSLNFEFENVYK